MADERNIKPTSRGGFLEWLFPLGFFASAAWVVWHFPAFILDFFPPDREMDIKRLTSIIADKDATPNMQGLFGGYTDAFDWLCVASMVVFLVLGCRYLKSAAMEHEDWSPLDRFAMFIGRVVMIMVAGLTIVMLTEVGLRYVINEPTEWANETTLWMGGFVFLLSGLYAMQQRSHIRITILYDASPRSLQRIYDLISIVLMTLFIAFIIYGSWKYVFINKFQKWQIWDSAFAPPIQATAMPMIIIMFIFIAIQGWVNLFRDWNKDKALLATPEVDEEEIEAIKKSVGAD